MSALRKEQPDHEEREESAFNSGVTDLAKAIVVIFSLLLVLSWIAISLDGLSIFKPHRKMTEEVEEKTVATSENNVTTPQTREIENDQLAVPKANEDDKVVSTLRAELQDRDSRIDAQLAQIQSLRSQLEAKSAAAVPAVQDTTKVAPNSGVAIQAALLAKFSTKLREKIVPLAMNVEVDPSTASIVFRMDDYFGNNSAELETVAKDAFKKFIPVYTDVLFNDSDVIKQLQAVAMIGFASPRFRKVYIDPVAADHGAYVHNMSLSINRSMKVAEYLFGPEIGDYRFKNDFKKYLQASGRGFMAPLPPKPGQPSQEPCGPYDCARSRRIELNLVLNPASSTGDSAAH